jgi:aspartate/tyrosine/aromatic aminotransferase
MGSIDILKIAKHAQQEKLKNPSIIDATIGMFYNDEQKLVIPAVEHAYHALNAQEIFKYGATDGGREFENNVIDWVLDHKKEMLSKKFVFTGLSTPGGSGALSAIFGAYGMPKHKVLVSDLRWRYDYFIHAAKMEVHEHKLFMKNKFNVSDFKKQLTKLTKKQKRVIVVINDPCHNPTGYNMEDSEWIEVVNILNSFTENEIILTLDIAYLDYNPKGFSEARNVFDHFMNLKDHVQVLMCFSASKSFAMYGIRLGAIVGLHHNQDQYQYFKKNVVNDALGKWSTAPSVGVGIFNQLVSKKDDFFPVLEKLTQTLRKRGAIFIKEAKKAKLSMYPYKGGFFVLVKSNNPEADYYKLVEKGIYLIPMEEGLRVALSCITTAEVYGLAAKIKEVVGS